MEPQHASQAIKQTRISPDAETQPRKLTMFGCLSPSSDLPNSISCARDSFSESELLSVEKTTKKINHKE